MQYMLSVVFHEVQLRILLLHPLDFLHEMQGQALVKAFQSPTIIILSGPKVSWLLRFACADSFCVGMLLIFQCVRFRPGGRHVVVARRSMCSRMHL